MDAFRTGLFRTADDISLAYQNAAKTFGFLTDGRDLVVISGGEGGRVATFSDHSDEGWPEVSVGLPRGARFAYAANGPLTRVARWKVGRPESEVLEELSLRTGAPRFESRSGGGAVAPLGFNANLKVRGATAEFTLLSFSQVREPEAIRAVIQNRGKG
jgi:hypothetical protein